MKKLFYFLIIPLMLLSNDKMIINYWTPFSGGDSRPMQFIVDKYNNSQDKAIVNFKVFLWADYYKSLKENINKSDTVDIAIVHGSKLPEFTEKDQLFALKELANKAKVDFNEFTDDTKDMIMFNDDYYAVPIDTHLLITYFNKKLIKNTDLLDKDDNLKEPTNEKEFIEFFKQIKNGIPSDIEVLGQPIDNVFPFWLWYSFYNQTENDGYIKDNKALFNNPQGLKALQLLTDLRDNGIYDKFITDNQAYNLFKYGKSAVFFTGVWSTWNFEQNKNLDFSVAPFPKIFEKRAMWADSHTLVIPKNTTSYEKKIEVLKFANFIADHGVDWSIAGHIPSKKKVLNDDRYKKNQVRYKYSKYLKFAVRMPKHTMLGECNDKMIEIFSDMMMSKKTAKETLQYAQDEIEKILNIQSNAK